MNKVILIGRLTRDPEVRYSSGENSVLVGRYTLAVERKMKQGEEKQSDFVRCVMFGKLAEFAEKYLHQGIKIAVTGRIQTGSYTNKDGQKVYTTDVMIESQEFVEKKSDPAAPQPAATDENGFMNIPEDIHEELPFN